MHKKGHFLKFISYVNFTGIVFGHNSPVNKQMKLWWHQCNSKEISKKKNDLAQTVKKIMKKKCFQMTFAVSIFITLTFEYYNQLLQFELICAKLGFNVNSCIQHCIQNNCLAKHLLEALQYINRKTYLVINVLKKHLEAIQ